MMRKFKFALTALLGFSAACSSVKNAPKTQKDDNPQASGVADTTINRPRIVVMYGVRPPQQRDMLPSQSEPLAPVLEKPVEDAPEIPKTKKE